MRRFDSLNEIKRERRSQYPIISVTAVLMRANIREMPDMVRLMRAKGVEQMNFVHMAVIGGMGNEAESLINDPKLANDMLDEVPARRARGRDGGHDAPCRSPRSLGGPDAVTRRDALGRGRRQRADRRGRTS